MTPAELNAQMDAMTAAANGVSEALPGLITVQTDTWIQSLWALRPTCAALSDGLRHRNIQVQIASTFEIRLLTRSEAGGRGAPYREPSPEH